MRDTEGTWNVLGKIPLKDVNEWGLIRLLWIIANISIYSPYVVTMVVTSTLMYSWMCPGTCMAGAKPISGV